MGEESTSVIAQYHIVMGDGIIMMGEWITVIRK